MPNRISRTLLITTLVAATLCASAAAARAQESARPTPNSQPAATKADSAADASAETAPDTDATDAAPNATARAAAAREDAAFFTSPAPAADSRRAPLFAGAQPVEQSGGATVSAQTDAQGQTTSQPSSQPSSQSPAPSTYVPLTGEQKMKRAAKNAFLSPAGYARTAFSSIWTQWNEDSQPHKTTEDEVADGATRFAINFGRRATRSLLGGGVYPVLFRQDPRYERAEEGKGVAARAGWAVSRVFVTRGDSGRHQPNVSNWAGSLSASALSNLWERSTPGHDRIGTDATFKRFANNFVNDAINNLFREFWPDIKGIFGR